MCQNPRVTFADDRLAENTHPTGTEEGASVLALEGTMSGVSRPMRDDGAWTVLPRLWRETTPRRARMP